MCWCTIPLVESGVEDQIYLRLYDAPHKKIWVLRFEFGGRKSGFEFKFLNIGLNLGLNLIFWVLNLLGLCSCSNI